MSEYNLHIVKGVMSPPAHVRADENQLENVGPIFQVLSEIMEGCLYLFQSISAIV